MVKVIFYNLLRSKYNVKEMFVNPGSIRNIIEEILEKNIEMNSSDFKTCVVFYKGVPIHFLGFQKMIEDNDEIIITHFVGGG
jgi:hypothetical protein